VEIIYYIAPVVIGGIMAWGAWLTKKVFAHDSCMSRVETKLDTISKILDDRRSFFEQIPVIDTKLDDLIKQFDLKK
jgi:hypothetical protein